MTPNLAFTNLEALLQRVSALVEAKGDTDLLWLVGESLDLAYDYSLTLRDGYTDPNTILKD